MSSHAGHEEMFPRMTSFIKNSRWRPDLLKACISLAGLPRTFKLNGADSIFLNTVTTHQSIFFHSLANEKGVSNKKKDNHAQLHHNPRVFYSLSKFVRSLIWLSVGPFFTHCSTGPCF